MLGQVRMSLAGTTGSINGTLIDASTKAPLAGAKITASSPSQTVTTTTDPAGRFSFFSLAPDTYTISAEKTGYEPYSTTGVTVFADQQQTLNISTPKSLRTIGTVTARGRADLVQPGRTTDAYTVTPAVQAAASALGGGGSLNQAYSALASVPGVYIPQGQSGIYQSVYIRGGNYTELGYEFDGVPIQRSFDQYPSTALSALGQQNLQVYAGSAPLDAQSSGLAGFINQVIKTGTNPSFVNFTGSLGSPTFYHQGEVEAGGATKNGNFSYYVATAGYNQQYRLFDNFNGSSLDQTYGTPYNIIAQNCGGITATIGCYTNTAGFFGAFPTGPTGYANGPFIWGFQDQIADRESVANFHIGIPHRDGTKDDIQLLYDNSYLKTDYQTSLNDWTYAKGNIVSGNATYNGVNYPTCGTAAAGVGCALLGGATPSYVNSSIYTGPVGVPLTPALVGQTSNYYFPYAIQTNATTAIPPAQRDTYDNRSAIEKVQYTKSLGSNAFARLYGYAFYSDWMQNGANSTVTNFAGGVSSDYELLAHTRGLALTVTDQVNRQNVLTLNGGYDYASTVRWNNSTFASPATVAYAVSSANPANGTCYTVAAAGAAGKPTFCNGSASRYVLNGFGTPGLSAANGPSVGAIATSTCGGAPCEYFLANNGVSGSYNTVAPAFTNLAFDDRIRVNEKLLLDLGVHYDDFRFNLTDTTVPAGPEPNTATPLQRQFFTNAFIANNCQDATTLLLVAKATFGAPCAAGQIPVTFSDVSPPVNDYHAFEPRFSGTYTVDPLTVLRASYSKIAQAPSTAYQQYNGAAGALPLVANFYPVGFRDPAHTVGPEYSYNTDLSIEHQFHGSDAAFSLTPFYRSTAGEIFNVVLDPKTNFISGINVGNSYLEGAEFAIHKGNFTRDGFSAQLSYTYTFGRTHYEALPNGQTVIGPINTGIQTYNGFTSFCATHGTDPRCNQAANKVPAAPCYTPVNAAAGTGGAPVAVCGPGDVANPYWNSPVQSLFSTDAFFSPFNQTIANAPGISNNSTVSSYVVPHVAALLLQYKHGPLTVTPTFQLSAGGKYGSPTTSIGIDPSTCGGTLGATGVAGDNRYSNGLPATADVGNEYLAQTCAGAIYTPNRYTGQFDNFGQYTEPATFTGNIALGYKLAKNVTFNATLVNVFDQCFGGSKVPWNNQGPKVGCWFTNSNYAGNFYNPGNTFQGPTEQYPYAPVFGNTFQQSYGGAANPFQAYFSLNVNL